MKKTTILIASLALTCLLSSKTVNAQLIWEGNTKNGTSDFAGLELAPGIINIVADPKGQFGQVYHFNIWDNPDGSKSRCEIKGTVVNGKEMYLTKGNTYYVGWRSLWDKNVGTQSNVWVALFQLHGYGHTGSGATFVIRTLGDGKIYLQNNPNGVNQHIWDTPIVREKWNSFVLHFFVSDDPTKGWVELWYNGVRQTFYNGQQRFTCPTADADPAAYNRLKWGIYRSGAGTGNWNAYMSGAKMGTTFASVDPDGGVTIPTVPAAPSNLTASVASCSQVNLAWTDNATDETSYTVENVTKGTSVSLPANSKSYSATGLSESTSYSFRVTAVNSAGPSTGNPTASATTPACPVGTTEKIWKEAESGTISSPMAITSGDATAAGGKYIMAPAGTNSSTTPPTTGYSNISITTTGSGSYKVWGRTIAPSTSSNSFYIRVDGGAWATWSDNNAVSTTWAWNTLATFTLSAGSHTVTISYREGGTKLDRILVTNDAAYTPTGMGDQVPTSGFDNIALEAENGTITSPMAVQTDAAASNGKYIMAPAGTNSSTSAPSSGYSTISFTAAGGSYKMWFRTILATTSTNSFYYKIDAGSWVSWNVDADVSTAWQWNSVASFALAAGSHTLTIAYREGGSKLDLIAISNDPAYNPSVLKSEPVATKTADLQLTVSPNPASCCTIQISYILSEDSNVKIVVYNMSGQLVLTQEESKETGQCTSDIDVSDLNGGNYVITVNVGGVEAQAKIIINK